MQYSYLVHWPLTGGLLHLVQWEGARTSLCPPPFFIRWTFVGWIVASAVVCLSVRYTRPVFRLVFTVILNGWGCYWHCHFVCGAGLLKWLSLRPSVCLSHWSTAAEVCGGFAAEEIVIDSRWLCWVANAGSVRDKAEHRLCCWKCFCRFIFAMFAVAVGICWSAAVNFLYIF